mgnify:CR=1 FL=1
MEDDKTPLPDVLGKRGSSQAPSTYGSPAGSSGLSFEEALELYPDLKKVWADARTEFEAMAKENDDLNAAARADIAVPGGPERLYRVQTVFARRLDLILEMLNTEQDQIRVEILRTAYQQLVPYWQSLVMSLHMSRLQIKRPGKVHESMLSEATALFQRVQTTV